MRPNKTPERRAAKEQRRLALQMLVVHDLKAAEALLCRYKHLKPGSNPLDGRSIVAEILAFEFPDE